MYSELLAPPIGIQHSLVTVTVPVCFCVVAKACSETYGHEYTVVKEVCVGHVQMRTGLRLRSYKTKYGALRLLDGKTVRAKGRLTGKLLTKFKTFMDSVYEIM